MHPSAFFQGLHAALDPAELLSLAHQGAVDDAHVAVRALHDALAGVAGAAPVGMFAGLIARADDLQRSFNPSQPDVELLNLASRAQHAALVNGLHAELSQQLAKLGSAQDALDEAHYVVRQYTRSHHSAAVLAAGLRTGHWMHQGVLARTTTVRAVMCVDLTAVRRLADIANCPPALIVALDRLCVAEAVAAAASAGCRPPR